MNILHTYEVMECSRVIKISQSFQKDIRFALTCAAQLPNPEEGSKEPLTISFLLPVLRLMRTARHQERSGSDFELDGASLVPGLLG